VNSCTPEKLAVSAQLTTPFVLLLSDTNIIVEFATNVTKP